MKPVNNQIIPTNFILDLDGVMTDGKFHYSKLGKVYKVFGSDDNDALKILSKFIKIQFISADKKGFKISRRRIVNDMNFPLELVGVSERAKWISKKYGVEKSIYMGDGIFDPIVFKKVFYSIAPANALSEVRNQAKFVTKSKGGERAVAEASLHILEKFFSLDYENVLAQIEQGS
jgi:3-deoxy-D-manno-octulosonate 8-phosphate phosphatase (KDO 8-P phosphatase)